METPEPPDLNQAGAGDTRGLNQRLAIRPPIAPPASALAFEIFPPGPLSTFPASFESAGAPPFQGVGLLPLGSRNPASSSSGTALSVRWSIPAEYSPPAAAEPGESSLQLILQTFQQKADVLQVPRISPPPLPGVITPIERFPDAPPEPASPSSGPPSTTTSSRLPPLNGNLPLDEPAWPYASPRAPAPGISVVPEPVAGALLCAGVALLYVAKRRSAL